MASLPQRSKYTTKETIEMKYLQSLIPLLGNVISLCLPDCPALNTNDELDTPTAKFHPLAYVSSLRQQMDRVFMIQGFIFPFYDT